MDTRGRGHRPAKRGEAIGRGWAETGLKPASGDVTLDFAAAFPMETVDSTLSSTTSELAATIDAILASRCLSLP